jgi:hypothetical protein
VPDLDELAGGQAPAATAEEHPLDAPTLIFGLDGEPE